MTDAFDAVLPAELPAPQEATAYAPSNIALSKYWGKRDDRLKLPAVCGSGGGVTASSRSGFGLLGPLLPRRQIQTLSARSWLCTVCTQSVAPSECSAS